MDAAVLILISKWKAGTHTLFILIMKRTVLEAVSHVAPCWLYVLCTLGLLVPACLRDAVYRRVARNRIRLFGAVDTCRRATKEDRRHFLEQGKGGGARVE